LLVIENFDEKVSKTIDHSEQNKNSNANSSIRSISPNANTLKYRVGTILRTKTEESTFNSIQNNSAGRNNTLWGSKGRQNKGSNSNERSKSKKKSASKEKNLQRPKTSKSQRKDKNVPQLKSKLFKNFYKKKEDKKLNQLNANINSLLSSNSTGITWAFPNGFLDRPASVIEDNRKPKINKITKPKDKSK